MTPRVTTHAEREQYTNWYFTKKARAGRWTVAIGCNLWYILTKWWKVSTWKGIFHVIYLISVLAVIVITVRAASKKTSPISSSPRVQNIAPDSDPGLLANVAGGVWDVPFLQLATIFIAVYKTSIWRSRRCDRREASRRETKNHLHRTLGANAIITLSADQRKAAAEKICKCVQRDIELFLDLHDTDVGIVYLVMSSSSGELSTARLIPFARNHDSVGWSTHGRPVFESYAYEAIRLRRSVVFHDVRGKAFRDYFPDKNRPYRTVYGFPVTTQRSQEPYGVVCVNLPYRYILWPKTQDQLDKLLIEYQTLFDLFTPGEMRHGAEIQYKLFD